MMKGFGISFLLLILLSGSLGEEGENRRTDENVRGVGIANGRERRKLSGSTYNREKDETIKGGKSLSRGGKGGKRESRNLLGSLLLLPQAPHTPHLLPRQAQAHRRQPLRLPGVGTPRGFIESKLRWCWQY